MSCYSTPTLGTRGERLDLLIRKGATLGPFTAVMQNPDTTPVNLTGCTIRGYVQKSSTSTTTEASIDVTSAYDTTGAYTFGLTAVKTAALEAGSDEETPEAMHFWYLELVDSLGRVTPLYYGDAVCVH